MKRFVAPAVAAVFVLAACGGASSTLAATVNGQEITVTEVEALIGETEEITPPLFAESLGTLVQWTIAEQAALADFDYSPAPADVDAEMATFAQQAGSSSVAEFTEAQGIPEDILRKYVRQLMMQEEVTSHFEADVTPVTDAEVAAELEDNAATWTTVCAAHVLTETLDEATAVLARIDSGEELADVAAEVSIDPGSGANGGELGCSSPSGYVAPFAEATMVAPIGELYGPVESEFGFHIIVVSSRTVAGAEEVRRAMTDQAVFQAAGDWFNTAVTTADVQVEEEYGTWTTDPVPQVVPA